MTSNSETLQQEMAALRLQYHENLSGEISELLHHSTLPELENLEQRVLTQLRDTAQRLAGSALTFGYEQIGLDLRALEGGKGVDLPRPHRRLQPLGRRGGALPEGFPVQQDEEAVEVDAVLLREALDGLGDFSHGGACRPTVGRRR